MRDNAQGRSQNDRGPQAPAAPEVRATVAPQAPVVANQDRGNGRGNIRAQDNKPADATPSDNKQKEQDDKDSPRRGRGRN
jgi:hypothetical protein